MSYAIIVKDLDGTVHANVCNFVDQKNILVYQELQKKNALEIEVIFSPNINKSENDISVTIEKWKLKKPLLGIFGKPKWISQTIR